MIVAENSIPSLQEFASLMAAVDRLLNADAQQREAYYAGRGGHLLEQDVYRAICWCAQQTPFAGSIRLVSGAAFPDIVAGGYYGVEVKSTIKNRWTSVGGSILESTRIGDVQRIFLTFGKLGHPVEFRSRPYEACLSGISVTHYPRYQIDMCLEQGQTIFDKMGIPYDVLRRLENPVAPVSAYYRAQLQPGERLWWAADETEGSGPPTLRLWSSLSPEEKESQLAQGCALFPELMADGSRMKNKYDRFSLWLVAEHGVVNTHLRDGISAGGQVELPTLEGSLVRMPAVFGRIHRYHTLIAQTIEQTAQPVLEEYWGQPVERDRIRQWCVLAAVMASASVDYHRALSVLRTLFHR